MVQVIGTHFNHFWDFVKTPLGKSLWGGGQMQCFLTILRAVILFNGYANELEMGGLRP